MTKPENAATDRQELTADSSPSAVPASSAHHHGGNSGRGKDPAAAIGIQQHQRKRNTARLSIVRLGPLDGEIAVCIKEHKLDEG
jgi:hypothetical protein